MITKWVGGNNMPSKSTKQHRLMLAAAHDPAIAAKTGIPQKVAREYVLADKLKRETRGK